MHDSRSRRAVRAATNTGEHSAAYWENILSAEGMPDRLPMLDASRLTPAVEDALTAWDGILSDQYATTAAVVGPPMIPHVLRGVDGRLSRRIDVPRVDVGMSVTATRGADGRYLRRAALSRVFPDAMVTAEHVDITEHDSPRSHGALRMVDVLSRGLACTGAALGSDAWSDRGGRFCAVKCSADVAAVLATAGEWATVGTWSRVSVDRLIDAREYVAAVKRTKREAKREAKRGADGQAKRVQAPAKKAKRAKVAKSRPIGAVRLAESGRGLVAALARWEACSDAERADVAVSFGLPGNAAWSVVRAYAVLAIGSPAASLADAMAVASVGSLAARVG